MPDLVTHLWRGVALVVFGVAATWVVANNLAPTVAIAKARTKAAVAKAAETPAGRRARHAAAIALLKGSWGMAGVARRVAPKEATNQGQSVAAADHTHSAPS